MRQLGNAICESSTQQVNDCYLFRGSVQRNAMQYIRQLFSKTRRYECQQAYQNIWCISGKKRTLTINYASFRYTNQIFTKL